MVKIEVKTMTLYNGKSLREREFGYVVTHVNMYKAGLLGQSDSRQHVKWHANCHVV